MKVFIFGIKGNMGQRYSSILKYLGHEVSGIDKDEHVSKDFNDASHVIVATPTENHLQLIEGLLHCGKPVLCEKPFVNDPLEIPHLKDVVERSKTADMQLSMVSQYQFAAVPSDPELTFYDYFKTGRDGLAWDCINIIWRAKGPIILRNQSPAWRCILNGQILDISRMDSYYIQMIERWLSAKYKPQYDRILDSHLKVLDYLDGKFA